MFFSDFDKLTCHQIKGLIPGGRFKLAISLDQRGFNPFGAVDELITIPALDTKIALIGGGVQG